MVCVLVFLFMFLMMFLMSAFRSSSPSTFLSSSLTTGRPARRRGEHAAVRSLLHENDVSNSRSDPTARRASSEVFREERATVGAELRSTRMGVMGVAKGGDLVAARRRAGLTAARKRPRGPSSHQL